MSTTQLAQAAKTNISDSRVAEIRRRLADELEPAIAKIEADLRDVEVVAADWRSATGNVLALERADDDRKRLQNRLRLLRDAAASARAELRVAEAQLLVDQLQTLAADLRAVGDERVARARDLTAAAEMLGAGLAELEHKRKVMSDIAWRASMHLSMLPQRQTALREGVRSDGSKRDAVEGVISMTADRITSGRLEIGAAEQPKLAALVHMVEGEQRFQQYQLAGAMNELIAHASAAD